MLTRKCKHLATYQMKGSSLTRNQASCNFLTTCHFCRAATRLLGVNEVMGNSDSDEDCHASESVLWAETVLFVTLLCESESTVKCPWGMQF